MAEKIHISPDNSHIVINASGKPSLRELKETIKKLGEIQASCSIDKLLVDARTRNKHPTMSQLFEGAEHLAEFLKGKVRIAIVVNSIDNNHKFFEDVAINRGAELSFFQCEKAARTWLFNRE